MEQAIGAREDLDERAEVTMRDTVPLYTAPTSGSVVRPLMISRAFLTASLSLDAMLTVPSSSTSIATPVWSMMPLMVFPPGPMMRRIWSGLTLIWVMRGAHEVRPRLTQRGEHPVQDEEARLARLVEGLREDRAGEPLDLDVHLDRGDALLVPQTLKSMSPRWSSSPRMSLRMATRVFESVRGPSLMRPMAIPATGALMGTPASMRLSVPPHTLAIDELPFDSRISLTTRMT